MQQKLIVSGGRNGIRPFDCGSGEGHSDGICSLTRESVMLNHWVKLALEVGAGLGVLIGGCLAYDWWESLPADEKAEMWRRAKEVAYELYQQALEELASSQRERVFQIVRDRYATAN